jgi:GT2 family glycosyltransferase
MRLKLKSLQARRQPQRLLPHERSRLNPSPPPSDLFDATVVIVTKNRKDELRQAVTSALQQTARIEVLVIDDGSTDGTAEMIRQEFPTIRLERVEESQGYIVHRNRAANLALSPILVSIDDDAAFSSPDTIQQTLAEFDHPRVGAVAIPSIDVNKPGQPLHRQAPPEADAIWVVDSFRGTAHALRRDVFCKLGGYEESFFHQGEEPEYCLRLLNAGFVVRRGAASPIHHFESPKRDCSRMFRYNARNRLLTVWYRVPMPDLLVHLPAMFVLSIVHGMRRGYLRAVVSGTLLGIGAMFHQSGKRRPVSRSVYRLSRQLRELGPVRLEAVESMLPQANLEAVGSSSPTDV